MSRPLRLEFPGAVWHVTSRGNERRDVFRDDEDRRLFLRLLARTVARRGWRLHAFVLMTNHHHLLVETPEPNLSAGMHELNGTYAQKFNRRHKRIGHLLQGRFTGILVSKESHLLELTRYVVLNPVRAGIVDRPEDWPWSSYCATALLSPRPAWLAVDWTLRHFGATEEESARRYAEFVGAGVANGSRPFRLLRGQIFLGDERFERRVKEELSRVRVSPEVPQIQSTAPGPGIDAIIRTTALVTGTDPETIRKGRGGTARLLVALLARLHTSATLRLVAEALSVHPSRVSRLAAAGQHLAEQDVEFRRTAEIIASRLRVAAAGEKAKGKT